MFRNFKNRSPNNSKGFTFLETLVVLGIFSLIFPLALSILFVIMQQQLRIFSLSEVKRQGDYIVSYLKNTISNNAYILYDQNGNEICDSGLNITAGDVVSFRDQYNSEFSVNYVDSTDSELSVNYDPPAFPAPTFAFQPGALNSSKVRIDSFAMSCERRSQFSAPLIKINFTICYNFNGSCVSPEPQKMVSLDYQANIKLRSYPTE